MKGASLEIKNQNELEISLENNSCASIKLKLMFLIGFIKNNHDLEFTCDLFRIATRTGYEWIQKWNTIGVNGLKNKPITGRKAKLSKAHIEILRDKLKESDFWDIHEVRELVITLFNCELSCKRLSVILREMKMNYTKPYRKDYRRPDNAEELLINSLEEACEEIKEDCDGQEEIIIGFVDEASPQNKANSGRFWSFDSPVMKENSTKYKVNTIGFYALNGNDALMFLEDSKEDSISQFIEEIRMQNPNDQPIIVVLDNFSSHKTELCRKVARDNGIYLVFLPPYSPDLNPIEFIWKSIRRMISKFFIKSKKLLQDIIAITFEKCVETLSFAGSWIDTIAGSIESLNFLTSI